MISNRTVAGKKKCWQTKEVGPHSLSKVSSKFYRLNHTCLRLDAPGSRMIAEISPSFFRVKKLWANSKPIPRSPSVSPARREQRNFLAGVPPVHTGDADDREGRRLQ